MRKAKDSKEYDEMLFSYIEKELGVSEKKKVSKKKEPRKNKESKVLNEKR